MSAHPAHRRPDALAHALQAIRKGSSSFASASKLFDEKTRESTLMLYAWCRHCDDVIDGQVSGHGQREGSRDDGARSLRMLEDQTRQACTGHPSDEPAFICLSEVMRRHDIGVELPLAHLAGFRMDVEDVQYESLDDTLLYCYRVAGVVGLMMARIMGARDSATLDRACDLGIAFQLTNIARDIVDDAAIGRVYVPKEWLRSRGIPVDQIEELRHRESLAVLASDLVETAEPYYDSAMQGLGALPLRSAWSVATARDVYRAIGRQVRAKGSHAWDHRVGTTGLQKVWFAARGAGVAIAARALPRSKREKSLWNRGG
ncbi:MAG: phytoene/squalene synthase family protein [Janthinobacterium lividum]